MRSHLSSMIVHMVCAGRPNRDLPKRLFRFIARYSKPLFNWKRFFNSLSQLYVDGPRLNLVMLLQLCAKASIPDTQTVSAVTSMLVRLGQNLAIMVSVLWLKQWIGSDRFIRVKNRPHFNNSLRSLAVWIV